MGNLLLITIFLLPLIPTNNNLGYEQIKVVFLILSITLIGFFWRGKGFKWATVGKVGGVFILILLITSALGTDPKSSLLGREPYFQGWILYAYLFLFYLMVKTCKIELKKYALVLSASALLVSFLAIKDWILLNLFNIPVSTYAGRVVSTFGQPNFYAGFLLLILPFAYLLLKSSNKKLQILGWGSGMISSVGILVSYSRSAILMMLILLMLGLIDQFKLKLKLALAVLGVVLISIFMALKFSWGIGENEIVKPISTHDPDLTKESVEKRVYIWPQAYQVALQKPFTGYGLENISSAFASYFEENKHLLFEKNLQIWPVLISLKDLNLDRTHNYILDLLLFSGILGALAWIFLIVIIFRKLILSPLHIETTTLIVGFVIYLIWAQFQNQSVAHLVYFWLLAGLIDSRS